MRWGRRQPPILEHEHDRHARKGLLHSENRGLNKRISESEASQPPARPAAAPCRRHHGIRRPRGRSNPRRVGGVHVFRWLDGVRRLDDLHHLEGEGGGRAAPRRHASKLGRTAISFDDDGNWRCRRVSDLSRYRQAQIGAAEVRQRRMSRRGRSGGNCSSCTPSPRQFSLRAAAVTRRNVLFNSRPSGSSRRLPTPGQVQHGQRRVAATSSQLLRRSSARPNQTIDPDRSRVQHSDLILFRSGSRRRSRLSCCRTRTLEASLLPTIAALSRH